MRSEKLKQLVKDKVPLKFRIKNEKQFKELREFMYALDVFLKGETFDYLDKNILAEGGEAFYLFSSIDDFEKYSMSICVRNHDWCCFSKKEGKEFDIINDYLIEECKWPNLKKLVESKTPLKFRVKDEKQSRELQKFLFLLDVSWIYGSTEVKKIHREGLTCAFYDETYGLFYDDDCGYQVDIPKGFDLDNDCLIKKESPPFTFKWRKLLSTNEKIDLIECKLSEINLYLTSMKEST